MTGKQNRFAGKCILCDNFSSLKKSKFGIKKNENYWILKKRKFWPKKWKKTKNAERLKKAGKMVEREQKIIQNKFAGLGHLLF